MKKRIIVILLASICCFLLLAGCKKQETADVSLQSVVDEVKKAYGDAYMPDVAYTEDEITELFGISKDYVEEVIAEGPMISIRADRFIAAKAAPGKAKELNEAISAFHSSIVNDSLQYPMNLAIVQASQVIQKGDYVFFVMLGEVPLDIQDTGDEAKIKKAAEEQIAIGVNAIDKAFSK